MKRAALTATASIVLLSATAAITDRAAAIFNGTTPDPTEAPWSVRVLAQVQKGVDYCSGSIVSRHLILTASHCVQGASSFRVLNAYLDRRDVSVRWDSNWSCGSGAADLALLRTTVDMSTIAGISPLPLEPSSSVEQIQLNHGVTLFGWGDTRDDAKLKHVAGTNSCDGSYKGNPSFSSSVKKTKDGSYFLTSGCQDFDALAGRLCFEQRGSSPSRVEAGDSGAAWVAWFGNTWLGLGVNHGGDLTHGDATSVARLRSSILGNSDEEIVAPPANTLIREAASGTVWLVGADGFRRWVPDGNVYNCLVGNGVPTSPITNAFDIKTVPEQTAERATCTPPTPPPPPPPGQSVSLSKGSSAQGQPGCTDPSCAFMTVSISGFAAGSHTVTCFDDMDPSGFYTYTTSNFPSSACYFGYPGHTAWITVDGVRSNDVVW